MFLHTTHTSRGVATCRPRLPLSQFLSDELNHQPAYTISIHITPWTATSELSSLQIAALIRSDDLTLCRASVVPTAFNDPASVLQANPHATPTSSGLESVPLTAITETAVCKLKARAAAAEAALRAAKAEHAAIQLLTERALRQLHACSGGSGSAAGAGQSGDRGKVDTGAWGHARAATRQAAESLAGAVCEGAPAECGNAVRGSADVGFGSQVRSCLCGVGPLAGLPLRRCFT